MNRLNERQEAALLAYVRRLRNPQKQDFAMQLIETLQGKRDGAIPYGLSAGETDHILWRINTITLDYKGAA
jgi:hypothetical protein